MSSLTCNTSHTPNRSIRCWCVGLLALVAALCCERTALARVTGSWVGSHPVSVVEADILVDRFRTTMKLTCFAEDLELLQGVEALETGFYDSEELVDAIQDHAKYLAEKVILLDANGEALTAKVTQVIDFDIPEEGIPAGKLMSYVMAFVLEYEYESAPEFLTLKQDMVADGALLPSELKVLLKQAGSETPYTHMLKPDSPQTFRFDWEQPLLAPDAPAEDWEDWFEDQRQKTLGINSYSSTYSFIYINDHEVRHEVLVPLATMATLIDFGQADERFLEIEEQEAARARIEAWFEAGNPVTIDGAVAQSVFDRIDFYGLDLRDFAVQAEARRVSMASGRVGVIISYAAAEPPELVEVTWDLFNSAIKSVDAVVFAYDQTQTTAFSRFLANNTFTWLAPVRRELPRLEPVVATIDSKYLQPARWETSRGTLAMFALAAFVIAFKPVAKYSWARAGGAMMIAAATGWLLQIGPLSTGAISVPVPWSTVPEFEIAADEGEQVFGQLHDNLFRAFDYREPSDVYDALAVSVDGPLLRKLYLDINQSLKMRSQGGAVARIDDVKVLVSEPEDGLLVSPDSTEASESIRPGFGWRCQWNLAGTVEHWGHVHQRVNQYDAMFDVTYSDGSWKITEMQMTDVQGSVTTSLRKLDAANN